MKPLAAWLTILGALVVGVAIGNFALRSVGSLIQLSAPCIMLSEAEKAGYLNAQKRSALIDQIAQSAALGDVDKAVAARLKTECPKL